ncbi:MAG: hypothetical protein RL632_1786, partial [Bacteroidota bacterium]
FSFTQMEKPCTLLLEVTLVWGGLISMFVE